MSHQQERPIWQCAAGDNPNCAADHHRLTELKHLVGFLSHPDGGVIYVVNIYRLTIISTPISLLFDNISTDDVVNEIALLDTGKNLVTVWATGCDGLAVQETNAHPGAVLAADTTLAVVDDGPQIASVVLAPTACNFDPLLNA